MSCRERIETITFRRVRDALEECDTAGWRPVFIPLHNRLIQSVNACLHDAYGRLCDTIPARSHRQ